MGGVSGRRYGTGVESGRSPRDDVGVIEIAITGALYLTFCAFLLFPHLGAPRLFSGAAIGLCGLNVVAAIAWSATHQECGGRWEGDAVFNEPCPAITGVFAGAVAVLTAGFFVASAVYGVRAVRRANAA
jgi:hypothetical protein